MATKFIFKSSGSMNDGSYFSIQNLPASASVYYLTDLSYNEAYNKVDVTTTNTSGDGNEFISGRAERSFTVDVLNDVSSSDIPLNTVFTQVTASFEGKRYMGSGSLYTKDVVGSIDDVIKSSYSGNFLGAVSIRSASQS